MFEVCVSTMRIASTKLYSSLSRLCAWHLTMKRPGSPAGYDCLILPNLNGRRHKKSNVWLTKGPRKVVRGILISVTGQIWWSFWPVLLMDPLVFLIWLNPHFITRKNYRDLRTCSLPETECKSLKSQERGRQPGIQEQQLWSCLPVVYCSPDNRPQQHQDQCKTVLQQSHSWSEGKRKCCFMTCHQSQAFHSICCMSVNTNRTWGVCLSTFSSPVNLP